ncbi:hypothetical protein [Rhodovulum adriaticum]|uniref:Uncharacterized protein n=1 Tax=Rhodovulum adriaticum TaxID=35804 RepID=A0A4V2SM84_RHOAD|nr:hypothetical protein [Rhodovulum adriaticum]MBK1636295.1 hypothetical protein [Rhodovulum adriaticum]TCP26296.1 hypothetical protein EV656_102259 [Rhodovulum adriaticum]
MSGLAVLLAWMLWAAAPLVAYAALDHGLHRAGRSLAMVLGGYSAAACLVWVALRAQVAGQDHASVTPGAVLLSWAGVAVLSLLLYALGAWIGPRK